VRWGLGHGMAICWGGEYTVSCSIQVDRSVLRENQDFMVLCLRLVVSTQVAGRT
jgi:hypothetical protein